MRMAKDAGYDVEVAALLDNSDDITTEIISELMRDVGRVFEFSYGDVGRSRNEGVLNAAGDFVAFLDADDMWGANWLLEAARCADSRSDDVIWHPEVNVYLGHSDHILHHQDMEDDPFEPTSLMIENQWTALSFGRRESYVSNPYPASSVAEGIGFEDWAWNMNVIINGAVHKVVRGTSHIVRKKRRASLSQATLKADGVPPFTGYPSFLIRSR
ncbi:hypothetical protein BC361_31740 [Ensifer sp. LC54]|nr:hypothetical protein BC361_31740 [Ensifer sp. LC54]OCP18685.1 hypothetical protein BC363_32040 [Ensifer sp. LC384]